MPGTSSPEETPGAPPRTPEEVERALEGVLEAVRGCPDAPSLRRLAAEWVSGRGSRQRAWFSALKSAADPAAMGRALNAFKSAVEAAVEERLRALEGAGPDRAGGAPEGGFDPTVPGRRPAAGGLHPITLVARELEAVFANLGFEIATGPEVEDPAHNFDGLNIPPDHPARDPSENFTLPGGLLLRSQTSPVQVRVLESRSPPLRILAPGRVYRPDTVDARHLYAFHQVEGLCVGEGISMADLKGTLAAFAEGFYGDGAKTRFRPSYFPFTEPSAEMDVSCPACGGSGSAGGNRCATCGGEGWMELLGCGMVHPDVLRRAGHDPERWTGFAFGMGIERAAMRRWGIEDIRSLVENDVRFLGQFR
ncbi:MAG: phenylalanine--tRNA ligase subunit alpha [Planctomycetes bacterium]|nr:phenylalanine--tRNA ligase subunit alpha [Planctomycetota bacterium]